MWLVILALVVIGVGFVAFTGAPYVPSKRKDLERAFTELYPLSSKDILVDIGSGDGVVLRVASAKGAHAIGYELHPILAAISNFLSRNDENVMTVMANFWTVEIPANTTVVYTFGDARDMTKMYEKVVSEATRIGHALYFISYGFKVSGLPPNKTVGAHHLYVVEPLQ